jgi:hypothetical protein
MDVLITPGARCEIEALRAFRPRPGTWSVLVGQKRGSRFIVEKVLAGGSPGTGPDERLLAALDAIWPGMIIGLAVVGTGAAFNRSLLGPAWFGKLVLRSRGRAAAFSLRPYVVGFDRRFFLQPVPFAPGPKEESHE